MRVLEEEIDQHEAENEGCEEQIRDPDEDEACFERIRVADEAFTDCERGWIKHVAHNAIVQVPLHSLCEERLLREARAWQSKIDHLLVHHGHEVIVFSHNAIRDVEWRQGVLHNEHAALLKLQNL